MCGQDRCIICQLFFLSLQRRKFSNKAKILKKFYKTLITDRWTIRQMDFLSQKIYISRPRIVGMLNPGEMYIRRQEDLFLINFTFR